MAFSSRSGMLMTKGAMMVKQNPPSLVCTIRVFRHPETGKSVTLHPIPNMATRNYFRSALEEVHLRPDVDVVLVEDGRLPFLAGTYAAKKQAMMRMVLPNFSYRPCVPMEQTVKFDGTIERDPVESRMAYTAVLSGMSPAVDPRARRALERIETYAPNTRVVCPWNVYHHVYFAERLPQLGYELVKSEEITVMDTKAIMMMAFSLGAIMFLMLLLTFRLLFGF